MTEAAERGIDEPAGRVPIGDIARVGDRLATGFDDRGDDFLGGIGRAAPSPDISPPRSLTTTSAPSAASASAWERPMPRPAPVTTATLPSS